MSNLTVISAPGLSARQVVEHATGLPRLRALHAATVVVLEQASSEVLERALITGMLPEYAGRGFPLWSGTPARVSTQYPLPDDWRAWDADPQLVWQTFEPDVQQIENAIRLEGPIAVVSAFALCRGVPAEQSADPLDRPVLMTHGFTQPKTCVGILEVAGILRRVLTSEVLSDTC